MWYASLTNRDIDRKWQSLSLVEAVRTIKYMLLQPDDKLSPEVLIKAFQELGEVYEATVSTPHEVPSYVFNLAHNSPDSTHEEVIKELMLYLKETNSKGLRTPVASDIISQVHSKLGVSLGSNVEKNRLLRKYCALYGYMLRDGGSRFYLKGEKITCILKIGSTELDNLDPKVTSEILYQRIK